MVSLPVSIAILGALFAGTAIAITVIRNKNGNGLNSKYVRKETCAAVTKGFSKTVESMDKKLDVIVEHLLDKKHQ